MAARTERLVVAATDEGVRLDVFLTRQIATLSRAQAQRLIRDGRVRADGRTAKPSLALDTGTTVDVEMPAPAPASPQAEPLPLTILFEDDDLVVVDKPAGLVVHPGAGHRSGTLVNALLHHVRGLSGIGGAERPGIVHRLDRGTSGVMVIAKHDQAHRSLAQQFHDREVQKEYVTMVWGRVGPGESWDRPLGRDPRNRQRMSSRARRVRSARTDVIAATYFHGVTLLRLRIATGRTHQIRVHLSEDGHPVVGDATYGGLRRKLPPALAALARLERPFLHARAISFTHPRSGAAMTFESPLPDDLAAIVRRLESHVHAS